MVLPYCQVEYGFFLCVWELCLYESSMLLNLLFNVTKFQKDASCGYASVNTVIKRGVKYESKLIVTSTTFSLNKTYEFLQLLHIGSETVLPNLNRIYCISFKQTIVSGFPNFGIRHVDLFGKQIEYTRFR